MATLALMLQLTLETDSSHAHLTTYLHMPQVMFAPRSIQSTKDEFCFNGNGLECRNTGTIIHVTVSEVYGISSESWCSIYCEPIYKCSDTEAPYSGCVHMCAIADSDLYILQLANTITAVSHHLSASVQLAACGNRLKPRAIFNLCELCDDVYKLLTVTPAYCIFMRGYRSLFSAKLGLGQWHALSIHVGGPGCL